MNKTSHLIRLYKSNYGTNIRHSEAVLKISHFKKTTNLLTLKGGSSCLFSNITKCINLKRKEDK